MNWGWFVEFREWITSLAIACAAVFAFLAARAARQSVTQQAKLVESAVNPILGLKQAWAGISVEEPPGYPVHLYLTNYGQGAAWVLRVTASMGSYPVDAHVGTPLCVGPGCEAVIQVWLPEKDKEYSIAMNVYYWDVTNRAHCTTIKAEIGWWLKVNSWATWRVSSEEVSHDLTDCPRPSDVQHSARYRGLQ